jgi:hypothetical protein
MRAETCARDGIYIKFVKQQAAAASSSSSSKQQQQQQFALSTSPVTQQFAIC